MVPLEKKHDSAVSRQGTHEDQSANAAEHVVRFRAHFRLGRPVNMSDASET